HPSARLLPYTTLFRSGGASSRDFMNCPPGTKLQTYLNFPTCWNGHDLDSADHISHMAFAPAGTSCPGTHPVVVPRLQFVITYPRSEEHTSELQSRVDL